MRRAGAFAPATLATVRPQFGILPDSGIEFLRERVFRLLEEHGVTVIHPQAVQALKAAGANNAPEPDRLRLPRRLVEEAVAEVPKQAFLAGRGEGLDLSLPRSDGGFIMRTGTGAHGYVDPRDARYRNMDLTAAAEIAAVADTLDQIGFVAHPFVHGVPEVTADIHSFATVAAGTRKHLWMQPYQKENVDYLMKIAAVAAGGEEALKARPCVSAITCSFSPLEFKFMDTEVIIAAGRYGVPLHACALPTAGGTAPLSPAASAIMAMAEVLGMVTIAHVLSPGTPVISTPLMFELDMRTGSALQSSVGALQAASMAVQLSRRGFGLLTHTYGSGSDTPDADHQSMAERAFLMQLVALSGADILGGIGQLECATVFSPVQAVLDNEMGAMMQAFVHPPALDDAGINWDDMAGVATGGHFLDSAHTVEACRAQFIPEIFQRDGRDDYEAKGRAGAFEAARDAALRAIDAAPEGGFLDEDQLREIDALVKAADKHIVDVYSGAVETI